VTEFPRWADWDDRVAVVINVSKAMVLTNRGWKEVDAADVDLDARPLSEQQARTLFQVRFDWQVIRRCLCNSSTSYDLSQSR
jgi:hypothetical protein